MAVPPYITVTYNPPLPSDTGAEFDAKAFDTVAKFNPWSTAVNGLADYVNDTADEALASAVAAAAGNLSDPQRALFAGYLVGVSTGTGNPLEAVEIVERPELTQVQVENAASTVMGAVSGERLAQAFDASEQQIGVGQTWQTVTRAQNTAYQNTTGKPIQVSITADGAASFFEVSADNSTWFSVAQIPNASGDRGVVNAIVPDSYYYRLTTVDTLLLWTELR